MKNTGLTPLVALCVQISLLVQPVTAGNEKGPRAFREDFTSPTLFEERWGMPTFSLYNFRADPSMVSNVSGVNILRLGMSETNLYPTGFIFVKEAFSYGSFAARIKVSDTSGVVASFFACTEIAKIFTDGTHDEIDFEFISAMPHSVLMSTWKAATVKEGKEQTVHHNSYLWQDPAFDIRQWHVYRFEWHPERVDFYIDEIKRWTSRTAIPRRTLQAALHIFTHAGWEEVRFPPTSEAVQMTDWVEYREFLYGD